MQQTRPTIRTTASRVRVQR